MSLLATSADVTKIKDKDPLSGTNEVNGDVMEGASFMQIVEDGPWSNGLLPFGYCLHVWCDLFSTCLGPWCPSLLHPMHVKQCLSMADFLELWNSNCVNTHGPSPFQISKICSRLHFKLLLLSIVYVTVTIRVNYLHWFLFMAYELFLWGSFVRISILAKMYR